MQNKIQSSGWVDVVLAKDHSLSKGEGELSQMDQNPISNFIYCPYFPISFHDSSLLYFQLILSLFKFPTLKSSISPMLA